MKKKNLLAVCCVVAFAGCGGGGDSNGGATGGAKDAGAGDSNTTGATRFIQAAGTQRVWDEGLKADGTFVAFPIKLQVTLDDNGIALASWRDGFADRLMTAVAGADGQWSTAEKLASGVDDGFPYALRANSAGRRVLLVMKARVHDGDYPYAAYFYTPSVGWSAPVPLTRQLAANDPGASDLTVDDDGTALISVRGYDLLGSSSQNRAVPAELFRLSPDGAKTTGVQTVPMSPTGSPMPSGGTSVFNTVYAKPPRNSAGNTGTGYLFWQETAQPGNFTSSILGAMLETPPRYTVPASNIQVSTLNAAGSSPTYSSICGSSLLQAKASGKFKATVLWGDVTSAGKCRLMATRLSELPSFQAQTDVLDVTPEGNNGALSGAKLLMDDSGNALAIWASSNDSGTHYWWSQSLAGAAWSRPADLKSSLGIADDMNVWSSAVAMSAGGDAVFVAATKSKYQTPDAKDQLSYAHFGFGAGWGSRTVIAEGVSTSGIQVNVDINRRGKATIMYVAAPCDDTSNAGKTCKSAAVYAYNF
ncbi:MULTISPECIES: hypothetical protein [unclassified Burkholderia]|uniref:hypothetical protein n=1 Tax=unclassified Burkholderia TaxID=2613784 RepID=UPI0014228DB3|nr:MULTISPECIES: hypothetical protein [unclassified Burkholderia]NIF72584.1 hypothetical protein [Burkholderia sp. Ap-962]NIF87722.1 hypothetical protein [Burkholderia sp. Cy-637]